MIKKNLIIVTLLSMIILLITLISVSSSQDDLLNKVINNGHRGNYGVEPEVHYYYDSTNKTSSLANRNVEYYKFSDKPIYKLYVKPGVYITVIVNIVNNIEYHIYYNDRNNQFEIINHSNDRLEFEEMFERYSKKQKSIKGK